MKRTWLILGSAFLVTACSEFGSTIGTGGSGGGGGGNALTYR